jgi:hypothetical protein
MKKIFCLIAVLMLMSGCDDGDMDYKTFDFSNQEIKECSNTDSQTSIETYYKINGPEGLILKLPKGTLINSPTKDPVTDEEVPREIVLGGSKTLTYENYVSVPDNLCSVSEIPAVIETWNGEGTLSVITTELLEDNKLIGYTHTITFENITFRREGSDESITINNSYFGPIKKELGFTFDFTAEGADAPVVKTCPLDLTLLYTRQGIQTLSLEVFDFAAYFNNTPGTKSITIPNVDGDDAAEVLFNVYKNDASDNNVCAQGPDVPSLPIQKWILAQGTIIIIPAETGGIYRYDIYLKDAVFESQTSGDSFELNKVVVINNPNGYFFGTYQGI